MSREVTLYLISKVLHCSQVFVGLKELDAIGKIHLRIEDCTESNDYPNKEKAVMLVESNNKVFVFDLQDGYWKGMDYYLQLCDFYYKRSYSAVMNMSINNRYIDKIKPLGFNMFVTCKDNPYDREGLFRSWSKTITGKAKLSTFTADSFVQKPIKRHSHETHIIFFTRLYDNKRTSSVKINDTNYINSMRIEIIRGLRNEFGDRFLGGLESNKVARRLAPDLIIPPKITEKGNYIRLLHSCDIGVGSMGLHGSIGWKTAEYIAASMGIVNEKMYYSVPGDFQIDKNYLDFTSAEECIEKVRLLIDNPDILFQMRINNQAYYKDYLAPDKLVWNALFCHEDSKRK